MEKKQISLSQLSSAIRILSADAVENASSGHPGMPLGFADVFTILATKFLRFIPGDPRWQGRDRLVLSAGHGSMLLYSFFYLAGFENYDIESLKQFRQINSITPGHPEYDGISPVEVTTGPLGQGVANAVGMAIAQKKYEQYIGEIMKYKIYCICGDGCLMEGIAHEAASLAGHLNLNNLIILFDDNEITIDGSANLSCSDDYHLQFQSMGWASLQADGHDFTSINKALEAAQNIDKPVFISFKTKIGYKAGDKEASSTSHGAALGSLVIKQLKSNLEWSEEQFFIPEHILSQWRELSNRHKNYYDEWTARFSILPDAKKSYIEIPDANTIIDKISSHLDSSALDCATRESSGKIIELIMKVSNKIIAGSCDLGGSTWVLNKSSKFITKDDFSGNYIHYGIRENAMAAIMNGLATQQFLPIGSSFLAFSDYMRPSMRLSCIMQLPVIFVMTHDSIGVGEDGPTHQPIEHLASLRSMPNLNVYRPCDTLEVEEVYKHILRNKAPSLLALSRQKITNFSSQNREKYISKGAYIFGDQEQVVDVSLWASGSEVELALETKYILATAGISSRLISCPSIELFLTQDPDYKARLLDRQNRYSKLTCAIEAASSFGWERIIGENGMFFGMNSYGASGPAKDLYKFFNLTPSFIAGKIIERMKQLQ
ncbi:MAG: transketolase [Alphaproteobacteria bacterium]|nr:transketolase [Alphaproteobacteria bacterium]